MSELPGQSRPALPSQLGQDRATALNRLRDSGGCGLVLSAVPREEIVGSERGALSEDRAVVDLIEHGAPMLRQWCATHDRIHHDPQLHTEKFQHDYLINKEFR